MVTAPPPVRLPGAWPDIADERQRRSSAWFTYAFFAGTMVQAVDFIRRTFVNLSRRYKQVLAVSIDACLLVAAFQLAGWLRFELFFVDSNYLIFNVLACGVGVIAFYALGLYRYILRYMNERVIFSIMGGILVSMMAVVSFDRFFELNQGLSRGLLIIYGLVALILLICTRIFARRLLFPRTATLVAERSVPVIIYGAGGAGSQLARGLHAGPHYYVVAVLDDDPLKQGLMMAGIRIYAPSRLPDLIDRHDVQQLLIAMPCASRSRVREIIEDVATYTLRIRLVPSLRELVTSTAGPRLRDLQVDDLLGRDPVTPLQDLLGRCVTDRVVMVSGGGGSIGSELCKQIIDLRPRKLVILEISEAALYQVDQLLQTHNGDHGVEIIPVLGSVRDAQLCAAVFQQHGVQTIYHAAAYKHVPIVEFNPSEGVLTNTFGTMNLSHCAIEAGVQDFVLISTDKAVRPTNIMGTSKRLAELVLQGLSQTNTGTRFSMVRFGNVLGSSGSVVPAFQKQIMEGGPITLTHPEITRYFMTIPEAAQLVLQAGSMGESGSVFVLDMGEPVRIFDLAHRMVRLYGLTIRDENAPNGDVEIRITGLRPGEKLYEELLIGGDVAKTEHPRILKARERDLPYAELIAGLTELENVLRNGDRQRMVDMLRKLVPEFNPNPVRL
jgi:FlaA1/EpsC-like NDP-sugar epimerase